jgi:hypothetical protein
MADPMWDLMEADDLRQPSVVARPPWARPYADPRMFKRRLRPPRFHRRWLGAAHAVGLAVLVGLALLAAVALIFPLW